jgi:hypothetical protein
MAAFWFCAGVIATPLFNQWVAPLLPGPRANLLVQGDAIKSGNPAGCTIYMVTLDTDESLDSAYLKLAFPQNVRSLKVGFPSEGITGDEKSMQMQMQMWEVGRGPSGECEIIQAAVNIDTGLTSAASANVLTIRTSKMAANSRVLGLIAVRTDDWAMQSHEPLMEDGEFEYTKWGLTVRRKLAYHYGGIDSKP